MSYVYLAGTIVLESLGVTFLNKAHGFSHWLYLAAGLFCFNLGMLFFALALKHMDVTIANTLWAGASILIVAVIGYAVFGERYHPVQYVYIGLVMIGLIGLNASGIAK